MANLLRGFMIGLSGVTDYPNRLISATVMLRVSGGAVFSSPYHVLCWNREQTEALYVRLLITSSVVGFPFPELPSGLEETPVDAG